jgi:hypothetical protein
MSFSKRGGADLDQIGVPGIPGDSQVIVALFLHLLTHSALFNGEAWLPFV